MKINWQGKHLFLCALFFFVNHFSNAQKNYGFYGKTNFVEFTSVSYIPVLKYLFNSGYTSGYGYKKSGNTLVAASPNWFNTGFRMSVGRAFKKNFGVSFEYGIDYYSTGFTDFYIFDEDSKSYYVSKHENLNLKTIHFIPKLHFASKSGLLPMGINHEVGIGFTSTKAKAKEYLYETISYSSIFHPASSEIFDFERQYRGIQLLYGVKMRKPLNKSIMLNYGFRYTIDIPIGSSSPNLNSDKYFESTNVILKRTIANHNFRNFLSFDLGLTFAF